jgi:hypothetical protein
VHEAYTNEGTVSACLTKSYRDRKFASAAIFHPRMERDCHLCEAVTVSLLLFCDRQVQVKREGLSLEVDGRVTLDLGRAVEVLEPESLRRSLIDFAEQIVGFYKEKSCDDQ